MPVRELVAVVLSLVRAFDWYANVGGLIGAQYGKLGVEFLQLQACDLFVEMFGQHVNADRVIAVIN